MTGKRVKIIMIKTFTSKLLLINKHINSSMQQH